MELRGQLRSDMFIVSKPFGAHCDHKPASRDAGLWKVPAPKPNRLKPHRRHVRSGSDRAAPTELERIIGGTVTINMSLLRSWAWADLG